MKNRILPPPAQLRQAHLPLSPGAVQNDRRRARHRGRRRDFTTDL